MQNDTPNTENPIRPDGWPRWLWLLVRLCVRNEYLQPLEKPSQLAQTARAIGDKLHEARTDAKQWRERAISAERVVTHEMRNAMKAACERHDQEHSTTLAWRL